MKIILCLQKLLENFVWTGVRFLLSQIFVLGYLDYKTNIIDFVTFNIIICLADAVTRGIDVKAIRF